MAPYIPLTQFKLPTGVQTSTPSTIVKKPTAPIAWKDSPEGKAFLASHATTIDEKGNVIQKNGQNVAPPSSPYNPETIQHKLDYAQGLKNMGFVSMGEKATQPTTTVPNNEISPKYADSKPTTAPTPTEAPKAPTTSNLSPTGVTSNTSANVSDNAKLSNKGLLSSLANIGAGLKNNPIATTAGESLINIGQKETPAVTQSREALLRLQQQNPYMIAAQYNPNVAADVASGRASLLGQTFGKEEQALATATANALASQGQQIGAFNEAGGLGTQQQAQNIGALGTAAGLIQPVAGATFFGSPLTGGLVGGAGNAGQTGTTGNQLIDGSVQKAYDMIVNNKTSWNDAVSTLVGGDVAKQALLTKLTQGGAFSPTIQNVQAQTNAGLGAQTQEQAYNLATALKSLDNIAPIAINFLNKSGLNKTDSPLFNQPINEYIKNLGNTAAGQQAQAIMNDIQSFGSQIVANKTAGTPTSVTEMTAAQNPSLLTATQLQTVLSTWQSLGAVQAGALTSQLQGAYGGNQAFTGLSNAPVPTNVPVGLTNTGLGSKVSSPAGQFWAGLGLDIGGGFKNMASSIGSFLTGWIAK